MSLENNLEEKQLTRGEFLKFGLTQALDFSKKTLASQIEFTTNIAVIEVTECTAFQGSGCKTCYEVCPLPDEAIQILENLPFVMAEGCTGCGICIPACPTPSAISLIITSNN